MTFNHRKLPQWAFFLALALLATMSGAAHAAPSFFSVPSDDLSIQLLLTPLFGGALPGDFANSDIGNNPFGSMLKIINAASLTIGGLLAAYTLVAGTMQTAHDGEMLGKRWSSMWLPIRTVLGVGLVTPLGSGYCVAQFIVMWLAVQGVGLANQVWSAFVKDGLSQMTAAATAPSPALTEFAINSLKIQTCMSMVERANKLPDTAALVNNAAAQVAPVDDSNLRGWVGMDVKTGNKYGTTADPSLCGTITRVKSKFELSLNGAAVGAAVGAVGGGIVFGSLAAAGSGGALAAVGAVGGAKWGALAGAVVGGWIGGINQDAVNGLVNIAKAHDTASVQMMASIKPVADAIASQVIPLGPTGQDMNAVGPTFDSSLDSYIATIQAKALGANEQSLTHLTEGADKGGWIMAGGWFVRIAAVINSINHAVNMVPTATYNRDYVESDSYPLNEQMTQAMKALDKFYVSNTRAGEANAWRSQIGTDNVASQQSIAKKLDESKIAKAILGSMSGLDLTRLQNDSRHPLITLQEVGNNLMTWIGAATLALTGVSLLPVGGLIAPLIGLVLFAGVSAAVVLSIYTPMMPFLLFLGAAFGWVLLVVEAMVAAPLWAIMHLSPQGDDLMGSARNGYSLLLSLMLRPALIVIGFAAAVIIVYPLGMLINAVYFGVFVNSISDGGSFYTAFMLIGGTVVYAAVLLSLLHKAFALIHRIPDELLKWFGGAGASLGQGAQEMAQGSKAAVAVVASNVSNAASQLSQAGGQFRQLQATQAGNRMEMQKTANEKADGAYESSEAAGSSAIAAMEDKSDPGAQLEAYKDAKNASRNHSESAAMFDRIGKKDEANNHRAQAKHFAEEAKGYAANLEGIAADKASAFTDAEKKPPTNKGEAKSLAGLATEAAVAHAMLSKVNPADLKGQGAGQNAAADSQRFDKASDDYSEMIGNLPEASPPPAPATASDGGDGSGA